MTEQTGRRAVASAFHAGKWEQADQLAELVYAEFGRCDVLVNNAGMSPLYPSLPEVSEELFDKVVGVNFKGPFRLASLIGTRMAEGAEDQLSTCRRLQRSRRHHTNWCTPERKLRLMR